MVKVKVINDSLNAIEPHPYANEFQARFILMQNLDTFKKHEELITKRKVTTSTETLAVTGCLFVKVVCVCVCVCVCRCENREKCHFYVLI